MFRFSLIAIYVSMAYAETGTVGWKGKEFEKLRGLQSELEQECAELETKNLDKNIPVGITDRCVCSATEGGTQLECKKDNACISSAGGEPMQGTFSTTITREGTGPSFTRTTTITTCFDYPESIYTGDKVCLTSIEDDLGTQSICSIQVGENENNLCSICRFCPLQQITFDCSNLGYEERTACAANNTDESILQFLYEPELVDECGSGGPTFSSGRAVTSCILAIFGLFLSLA